MSQSLEVEVLAAKGKWSDQIRDAFIAQARTEMLSALKASGKSVSAETVAWVDAHEDARLAVYASVSPADPRILINLDQLRTELGDEMFQRYRQFCLGAAVARRSIGVGAIAGAAVNLKFAKLYEWGDEARAKGVEPEAYLAGTRKAGGIEKYAATDKISAYLKQHALPLKDAYVQDSHRKAMEAILTEAGVKKAERALPGVLRSIMLAQELRPAKRSDYPRVSEYLVFLDKIYQTPASQLSLEDGQRWPLYPVKESPWPILMPLSMTWPLDEAEHIWEKYQGKHGGKRLHTYGPYNRFPVGVDRSLEPSPWHWSSWPSTITTGGVCGTMSSIANGTLTSLGVPIVKAGQPGHSCIVRYDMNERREYLAAVGQAATGGPDKTTAPWLFADQPKVRSRGKFSVYSEYHFALAQAMNAGLDSFLDTRIALHMYRAMPEPLRLKTGRALLLSALKRNPYNIEAWYVLAEDSRSGAELVALFDSFNRELSVKAERERQEDRDASADLGEDKINPKSSTESKIATLRHIGQEQMAVIALRDLDRFSKQDLQLVSSRLNRLIESGDVHLTAMLDRCRCRIEGVATVQSDISAELTRFLAKPPKGRKNMKRAQARLSQRIATVASFPGPRDARETWLRSLLDAFSDDRKVVVSKKKGKQLDKFYGTVLAELTKSLKAKPANKKSLRELNAKHQRLLKGEV
ncbi:hypothetical protein HW115_10470 [Verrucomicrobiaceae bacterium N1E253]|uniref:Uncharacterized protein n=1 Tax=Oceaniferula marina TaxID=2748318 RepID=A0A851GF38_9BACT|nr:hypothetical protein [Oceaniferula marina]NWK56036.1 hypothetical protein [Oceaniferula marina]